MMNKDCLAEFLLKSQSTNTWLKNLKKLSYKYNIYICGGYIRSVLLNNTESKDIDIFVDCNREEFLQLIDIMSEWGEMHYGQYGSPRLYINDSSIKYIDIVPFYNFIVAGMPLLSIEDILYNFDFTANAIAWDFKDDELLDPLNGIDDIKNRTLRAVRLDFPEMPVSQNIQLSAVTVFWFRLLHYQNVLGLQFDKTTEEWVVENKQRMNDYDLFCKYFFVPSISTTMTAKLKSNVL